MTDFNNQSDRAALRESMTDEEWRRLTASEPGHGGGPNSKYFSGAKKPDFHLLGTDLFGSEIKQDATGKLREKFEFPPFTVLNAREGPWQERKRAWLACGIQSEVGRGENLLKMSDTLLEPDPEKRAEMQAARQSTPTDIRDNMAFRITPGAYQNKDARTFGSGDPGELSSKYKEDDGWKKTGLTFASGSPRRDEVSLKLQETSSGTSIFDPVLTELCYKWFCPPGGMIVDPFAGGSVRGIVAGLLGFQYHGIDLRPEQIAANEAQRAMICPDAAINWVVGDSNKKLLDAPMSDLSFSCPPYADLEQYSEDPDDISNMPWEKFVGIYRAIIRKSVERMKPNTFAVFVVGEVRDKKTGLYRGFVPLTCASFMAAGAAFYNEAILVTAVGSLPIRVTKQFETSRKLGRTHQSVLCFVKGDPKLAAEAIAGTSTTSVSIAVKRQPRPEPKASDALVPNACDPPPSGGGSLAQFLGTQQSRPVSTWTPQEPPSLDGINEIVLNFATDGLDWAGGSKPVGVTVSTLDGQMTRFLPFAFEGGGNLDLDVVKRWLKEQVRNKHILNGNTRFDMHMANAWGIDLEEQSNTFSDIMHTAALLDDHRKRFALDVLAKDFLPNEQQVDRLDERSHSRYAAYEVAQREIYTAQLVGKLRNVMYPMLEEQELREVQSLEDAVIPVVVEMERNGAFIDMPLLEQYSTECTTKYGILMMEIAQEASFAFEHTSSGWQRLFEHCGLTPSESYAEDVVGVIDHPLIKKAHYAGQIGSLNSKTFAAYKKQIGADGILRYDINQLRGDEGGTVSGRFSIGYVQQVPNHDNHSAVFGEEWFPRRLYIPKVGSYLDADAAQIEYRIFAHFASNPQILKAYQDDPHMSFHKFVWGMTKVYKPDMKYTWQKSMNFMKMYGGGLAKLAMMMGFITKQQYAEIQADPNNARKWDDPLLTSAKEIQQIYERVMPEVGPLQARASHLAKSKCDNDCAKKGKHAEFIRKLHKEFPHRGYVKTLVGRRSRFPNNYKTYRGLNRVISGTAADVNKKKLVELHAERKHTAFLMRLTVHDSVGGDAQEPDTLSKVDEILNRQSFPQLKVPIFWEVKQGPNWAETK